MENELIKISKNENGELLVSARDLHEFLILDEMGKGTEFAKWFKRMCEYGFEENVDYVFVKNDEKSNGRPQTNYALKIDMAKEIAMIQRNDKGKVARLYFIECEKRLKEQVPQLTHKQQLQLTILNGSDMEKVLALKEYEEVLVEPYKQVIEEQKPKVEFAEAIQVSDTNLSIGNFSKQTKLGRNELFKFLRENKILFIDNGSNVPYQKYINRRYFVCTQVVTNNHINVITKVTTKGQEWLFKKFPQLKRKE